MQEEAGAAAVDPPPSLFCKRVSLADCNGLSSLLLQSLLVPPTCLEVISDVTITNASFTTSVRFGDDTIWYAVTLPFLDDGRCRPLVPADRVVSCRGGSAHGVDGLDGLRRLWAVDDPFLAHAGALYLVEYEPGKVAFRVVLESSPRLDVLLKMVEGRKSDSSTLLSDRFRAMPWAFKSSHPEYGGSSSFSRVASPPMDVSSAAFQAFARTLSSYGDSSFQAKLIDGELCSLEFGDHGSIKIGSEESADEPGAVVPPTDQAKCEGLGKSGTFFLGLADRVAAASTKVCDVGKGAHFVLALETVPSSSDDAGSSSTEEAKQLCLEVEAGGASFRVLRSLDGQRRLPSGVPASVARSLARTTGTTRRRSGSSSPTLRASLDVPPELMLGLLSHMLRSSR